MSYNLNIDLLKYKRATTYTFTSGTGEQIPCVVIPIKENYIAIKETNGILHAFSALNMWERTNKETNEPEHDQYGNSHALQLQIPKEVREQMGADERRAASIYLGSAKPMGSFNAPTQQAAPQPYPPQQLPTQQQRQDYSRIAPPTQQCPQPDDLPFYR